MSIEPEQTITLDGTKLDIEQTVPVKTRLIVRMPIGEAKGMHWEIIRYNTKLKRLSTSMSSMKNFKVETLIAEETGVCVLIYELHKGPAVLRKYTLKVNVI